MTDLAIKVEGLGKMYRIQHRQAVRYAALRDVIAQRLNPMRWGRTTRQTMEEFWALRDVSFEVPRGQALGILGRNGAGKSTLLKVLSRITGPTTGRAALKGRVGSLLEVGTGFHPELTGRENVYLNGSILGMSQAEIRQQFDAIVDFAEVERFIDTPVKRYSSGMYVRLAFAVAAHLQPDILVVDEVLAVGDIEFQKKCIGRMEHAAGAEGRTILFVSHNLVAVRNLCSRGLWLDSGKVVADGSADDVVASFISRIARSEMTRTWPDRANAPGNKNIWMTRASVRVRDDAEAEHVTVLDPLIVEFDYELQGSGTEYHLSVMVWNEHGVMVFNSFPDPAEAPFASESGAWRSSFEIPGNLLNAGTHRLQVFFVANHTEVVSIADDVLVFDVQDRRIAKLAYHGGWGGAVRPILRWQTYRTEDRPAAGVSFSADDKRQQRL